MLTDSIHQILDRIEAQRAQETNGKALDEPRNALEYMQDVYKGRRQAEPWRMRAAMAALPFESPKLSVSTNLTPEDFAMRLERAIQRSGVRMIEGRAEPQGNGRGEGQGEAS
jgi:hypothetical protein